jgi:hypothetical protein
VRAWLAPALDGSLTGEGPVALDVANERLQARASPRGVRDLLVWGSGRAADVRFEPRLPPSARVRATPNRVEYDWDAGRLRVSAHPRLPALVLRGAGALPALRLVRPRSAPAGFADAATRHSLADGWFVASAWTHTVLRAPDGVRSAAGGVRFGQAGVAVVAAGADRGEAERAAAAMLADPGAAEAALDTYQAGLREVLALTDPELQSLVLHGLHTAFSARRTLSDGRFAGFAAGAGYASPPRTYYRDSYWTLQALLPLAPHLAREQLFVLARGIHPGGEAGSAVILAAPAGDRSWRAQRAADPALVRDHPRDTEWWADHSDSPLFFVLLACEVATWTGDPGLLAQRVDDRSLDARIAAVLELVHAAVADTALPYKPPHDRDWADNVVRGGAVTYHAGLYHGALTRVAALVEARDPGRAARYRERAASLRRGAARHLWRDDLGHFVEFRGGDGRAACHLSIDTLTALRYGLADDDQATRVLHAMRERLETRHNVDQRYGDWGVMCVYPPYAAWVPRRAKSRFPFRYHNGADWPYWDGVYAEQRLLRRLPGWRYPLTRWWSYGLARGWATPVEYYSPPYGPGSPNNAWSAMPAAAMMLGGLALTPSGGVAVPPWGACVLQRALPDGRRQRVTVRPTRARPRAGGARRGARGFVAFPRAGEAAYDLEVEHDG